MTKAIPPCIFCGKPNTEPHKEEILAKWIARIPGKKTKWKTTHVQSGRTFDKVGEFGLVTRAPCRQCNNKWMSKLENKTLPILMPMFQGTSTTLSEPEQFIIAKWLLKTAITNEQMEKDGSYFFQIDECIAFKERSVFPATTIAVIGRFTGS